MKTLTLALALGLPALTAAEETMWKWRDARGRLHYSNVQEAVPQDAETVTRQIGIVEAEPRLPDVGPASLDAVRLERLRTERAIRRQLAEIDDYKKSVRARQYWRLLQRYPNSWILSDWMVTDRWLALNETSLWLEKALDQIERRKGGIGS